MSRAEAMVLVMATVLAMVVVAKGRGGTLTPRVGALLLLLAILAVFAALLHMVAP
jgi:hypothetical protein